MAEKIKFFNSFVLKKNVNELTSGDAARKPVFAGLPSNPNSYPIYPTTTPSTAVGKASLHADSLAKDWIVEEARINGDFNGTQVGYGVRAYLVEDTSQGEIRSNALIYSGVYNSNTGLNETNVFPQAEQITKAVDPANGSIQKLHALDSNLAIFQENKVSNALIDKDAIYSAEGGGTVTSSNLVIGQVTPYVGEYGISTNPESFANYGYRRYFTDKYRNSVMRLSRDGLTEISRYGMSDFFRDEFNELNDTFKELVFEVDYDNFFQATTPFKIRVSGTNINLIEKGIIISIPQSTSGTITAIVIGVINYSATARTLILSTSPGSPVASSKITATKFIKDRIIGGWDNYNKNYVLSIQNKSDNISIENTYKTLSFEEDVQGWNSFYTYEPKFISSLKGKYYSFYGSEIYEHHSNTNRGEFYGATSNSSITFIFNANPSINKVFKTVNYEGSNGWEVNSILSDFEGFDKVNSVQKQYQDSSKPILSYNEGLYTENGIEYRAGFNRKENKYYANLVNDSVARPGEVLFGNTTTGIKGFFTTVKISTDATTDAGGAKELFAVSTEFVVSSR